MELDKREVTHQESPQNDGVTSSPPDDSDRASGPVQGSSVDGDGSGNRSDLPVPSSVDFETKCERLQTFRKWVIQSAGALSAIVAVAVPVTLSEFGEIDGVNIVGLLLVVLSFIWSVAAFLFSHFNSQEQQLRDRQFQLARDEWREGREEAREEKREKRVRERARGEILSTIATHVVDINGLLEKINVLAPFLMDTEKETDSGRFVIRCPKEIRSIVKLEYRQAGEDGEL